MIEIKTKEMDKPKKKKEEMVTLYHKNNSEIKIKKSQVENHLAAGWRLSK